MHRRTLVSLPLLALAGISHQAWSRGLPPPWPHDVTEIRVAASGAGAVSIARRLQARLGIHVVAVPLQGDDVAHALNAGQLECALLDVPTLALSASLMAQRLERFAGGRGHILVTRQCLPTAIHAHFASALSGADRFV